MRSGFWLGMVLVLTGCGGAPDSALDPALSAPAEQPAASAGGLVALDAEGRPTLTLLLDGSHVEVAYADGQRWIGEQRGDKRRWRRASDGVAVAEVKAKGDDFKLRSPEGTLLWKVKLGEDKIKVSDNEENQRPWQLKTGYPDKAKLLAPDEFELGEVRFGEARTKVKDSRDEERYRVDTTRRSAAWGLLLAEAIPEAQRAILIAEIAARGR